LASEERTSTRGEEAKSNQIEGIGKNSLEVIGKFLRPGKKGKRGINARQEKDKTGPRHDPRKRPHTIKEGNAAELQKNRGRICP